MTQNPTVGQQEQYWSQMSAVLGTLHAHDAENRAVTSYLQAGTLAKGTKVEYQTMLNKWQQWGNGMSLEKLGRKQGCSEGRLQPLLQSE